MLEKALVVTEDNERRFQELKRVPRIAWPTVILFFCCLIALGVVTLYTLSANIPFWLGSIVNGLVIYFLFSAVHDASHRSISTIPWINESIGHIGLFFFGPLATFGLARWIHSQHHRFTNYSEKDPDNFGHEAGWKLFQWFFFDYFYTKYFLQQAGDVWKKYGLGIVMQALFITAVLALAIAEGYLYEVFMLFVVPTRISSFLFVAMFVYLPHVPFHTTSLQNEYQATNIRAGWEGLLSPLMAYQNYHLVHHLYTRVPFYRMVKIWNSRLQHHLSHNPYFVRTFSVSKVEV